MWNAIINRSHGTSQDFQEEHDITVGGDVKGYILGLTIIRAHYIVRIGSSMKKNYLCTYFWKKYCWFYDYYIRL